MGFLDTAKTIVFGDQNNRQDHGFRAGFVPTIVPSLVATGGLTMGAPAALVVVAVVGAVAVVGPVAVGAGAAVAAAGTAAVVVAVAVGAGAAVAVAGAAAVVVAAAAGAAVAGACLTLIAAKEAKQDGYNVKRFLVGEGAGCVAGAALVFNVASGHLPPEQPKAPLVELVPSTLEIKPSGGGLCKNFNVAETTDAQGRMVYILTVPDGCTVPAAAAAVPR